MNNLLYKGIDVMKLTKDTVNSPLSDANIQKVVTNLKALNITHISISVPLDYPEQAKRWADAIHAQGLKVLHRGTWNEIEGLYGKEKAVGSKRPANAAIHWLNKTNEYIVSNPGLFADDDLWGVLPERTEGIFQDDTSFLPHEGGAQQNYANFFNSLVVDGNTSFAQIGKKVKTGFTANNWTEIKSGWIQQSVFDKANILCVDHYGLNHTPQEMEDDLKVIQSLRGKKVFLQEWGNYWNNGNVDDAKAIFEVLKKLATEGTLVGFNYWGGWGGTSESILNNDFSVNEKGKLLGEYFKGGQPVPTPTPTPVPTPTPTPTPGPQEPEKVIQVEGLTNAIALTSKGNIYKYTSSNKTWTKIKLPTFE